LIDACEKLHLPLEGGEASQQKANFVFGYDHDIKLEEPVFLQYVPAMIDLWKNSSIQAAFDRRREFQLVSSSTFIFYSSLA
jgi:guanine nucleotide-binding protein subunit alpha-12